MERQLQLKTQQQITKEYMEARGLKEEQEAGQSQGPGPGPGSTASAPGPLPALPGALAHTSSDTDEEAIKDGEQDEQQRNEGEEVSPLLTWETVASHWAIAASNDVSIVCWLRP